MDSAPRMPSQHRRRLLGRSATNESPKPRRSDGEERLTPPLEIFVKDLCSSSGHEKFDVSSSAMTEITFDSISQLQESGTNLSVTSDVSSLVDQHSTDPITSACESGVACRLPRRQSSRRPRTNRSTRKGVMRWSSMPMSNLQSGRKQSNDPLVDASEHGLKPPQRRNSNPSILSDEDDDDDDEVAQDSSPGETTRVNSHKEQPRLPIRKKSSESLFSNVKVSASSSECGTADIVVGAHAA